MWRIGARTEVRIGIDHWLGCKWRHILPDAMIDKLHTVGKYVLKDIACFGSALLQDQGWLNADLFGFDDQEITIWNSYITLLTASHAKITTEDDKLIWILSKTGKYTPKAGYFHLILDRNEMEKSWWWKWLWKLTCPLK